MSLPMRKNNRLGKYDYSQNGAYFITICVKDRKEILSEIVGAGVLDSHCSTENLNSIAAKKNIYARI